VPPEDRRRIFEPFVRLGSDEISGAGIGLFSCRRVAEAQGGALWFEDPPDGVSGSVFAFSVPLARGDDR
jgi:signal transduction histidine kinase